MIVAVAGGKGGVGTTTVALNLAAELDGVVVDADLSMADLPRGRGPDLHDVLAGRADPVEAVRDGGPVAVLPCGRSLAGARAADPTGLSDAVGAVAARYGTVVLDCPAGADAAAGLPLAVADAAVVVTTPDEVALRDAVRVRELARDLDAGLVRVVLNRMDGGRDTERVRDALGAPVVAVPEDDRVAAALASGHPVRSVAPESAARERFQALASTVASFSSE
jgi:septum site-determining protein MinD